MARWHSLAENIVARSGGNTLASGKAPKPGGATFRTSCAQSNWSGTFVRVSGPHHGFDMTEEEFCGVVENLIG
jgi:hypothetical protein